MGIPSEIKEVERVLAMVLAEHCDCERHRIRVEQGGFFGLRVFVDDALAYPRIDSPSPAWIDGPWALVSSSIVVA